LHTVMNARSRISSRRPWVVRTAQLSVLALTASAAPLLSSSAAGAAAGDIQVRAERAVYATDEGRVVRVGIRLAVEGGGALSEPVDVSFATGSPSDTATAGVDYTPVAGTLRFPASAASGSVRYVRVAVRDDAVRHNAETAETIALTLRTTTGGATVAAEQPRIVINAHGLPYLDRRRPVSARVRDLVGRMTLEEKVGQMTQAERGAVFDNQDRITQWQLGSVLSGGGSTPPENTPEAWADMVDSFQSRALATRLQIPLIYGVDSVHGHGNLHGATIFPHNVGLGSTRNRKLVERVEHVTAKETRATGIPWVFAPCLCVARDTRWGRTYESFGEDPSLVIAMETAIDGFQGTRRGQLAKPDRVLATAKHYAGDGDTEYGTGEGDYTIDQGDTIASRPDFFRINVSPYVAAVRRHHVGSVMPSFSTVDFTEDGVGNRIDMHAHRELITDELKGRIGFDGFIISDWEGIHDNDNVAGLSVEDVRLGVAAGIDLFMQPFNAPQFQEILLAEVRAGRVPTSRINDAVSRILTKKFELGLFDHPYTDRRYIDDIGSAEHRAVARRAAAESQVLLKNDKVLPLRRNARVYVAGRNADNVGNQSGGWTITWQGGSGDNQPGMSILEGIREVAPRANVTYSADASAPTTGSDVGVVVVGETSYSEGFGDVGGPQWAWDPGDNGVPREPKTMELKQGDRDVINRVCGAMKCVVLVVSGRPQVISDQLSDIDALVASWLPGTEGAGVADVLFGRRPFTGQLSMTWPRTAAQEPINVGDTSYDPQYPFGWGLRTDSPRDRLAEAVRARRQGDQAARADLSTVLAGRYWAKDGSVQDQRAAGIALNRALAGLSGARDSDTDPLENVIVSILRDIAQAAVVAGRAPANAAALIANADVALLSGDPLRAAALLLRATGRF
jgi:beta-glucosidase